MQRKKRFSFLVFVCFISTIVFFEIRERCEFIKFTSGWCIMFRLVDEDDHFFHTSHHMISSMMMTLSRKKFFFIFYL